MSKLGRYLLLIALLEAGVYLFASDLFSYPANALLKAQPVWLLALVALLEAPNKIRLPLTLALVFSGIGDFVLSSPIALSFPLGMIAFLIGHLFYLWIFLGSMRSWSELDNSRRLIILLIGLYALSMGLLILPRTGALLPAIAIYFAVLSMMAAASFASLAPRWTRLGAVLFVLSDTLIGIDQFLAPLDFRHLAVMGTYYAAQALILAGLCWQKRTSET